MDDLDVTPPQRDYGPNSSLLKRRIMGGICIALVVGFVWFVVAVLGDSFTCEDCISFGSGESEAMPTWMLVVGAAVVVAVALIVPALAEKWARSRADAAGR